MHLDNIYVTTKDQLASNTALPTNLKES